MGTVSAITTTIAALAAFLVYLTALKYAVADDFTRTRLGMSSFFLFIIFTLSVAFWPYRYSSMPYAIPAMCIGIALGWLVAVQGARRRIMIEGMANYLEHATHVHLTDLLALKWWSVINVYSIMAALLLINLVGLSTVIFVGREGLALATCTVGAALLGSIAPYLYHLWTLTKETAQALSHHRQ